LVSLLEAAQTFIRELFGQLALGNHEVSAGVGFASCLVSFNLGLDISVSLTLGLPFVMEVFLGAFAALLAQVVAAVASLRAVLCIPQGLIQLLFGGICGFKPFDFDICPPDLQAFVDRLVSMLNVILSLVTKITGALLTMQADVQSTLSTAVDLKGYSACAVAAAPIGVALDLLDPAALSPAASAVLGVT
jgi:hypothetical protein